MGGPTLLAKNKALRLAGPGSIPIWAVKDINEDDGSVSL